MKPIGPALARNAEEVPIPKFTDELKREITIHCNFSCALEQRRICPWYDKSAEALKKCGTIKAAEQELRLRAGC